MLLFPTVEKLASAPQNEVLKAWEGLGYYSRAKNLHEGAKEMVRRGAFPDTEEELLNIRGIGPYTSKAILSFAFQQKKAPVDGNVNRVVSRLFGIQEYIEKQSTKKVIAESAESLLPENEPYLIAEALIELGATVCQKKAACDRCPVAKVCRANQHSLQSLLPRVKQRAKTTHLTRIVAVILFEDYVLIRKGEKGKVMEHLLEFPYLEEMGAPLTLLDVQKKFIELQLSLEKTLSEQTHAFTRYKAHLTPYLFIAGKREELEGHEWVLHADLKGRPFSAGHRKIFEELCD